MKLLSFAKSCFRLFFRRREIEADLDEEIRSAVALLTDEKIKAGMAPAEARRAARIELGGVEQVKEEVRSGRAAAWLDSFVQDVRFAFRMLRKSPGFATIAVLTLALGIGANTAIFSLVNCLVLRPLPIADPSQVAFLTLQWKGSGVGTSFSYPNFREIQQQTSNVFSGLSAVETLQLDGLSRGATSQTLFASYVTGNFFALLGVKPALGRLILPSEGQNPGADPVLVISYSYWKSRFNGDPSIVGAKVSVNGHPMTIIGITPKGFHGLTSLLDNQGYIPLGMAPALGDAPADYRDNRTQGGFLVIARLRSTVSLGEAGSALHLIAQRMSREHSDLIGLITFDALHLGPAGLAVNPGHPETLTLVSDLFLALAGSVLLLACMNIANLLLVRSDERQREMAMRAALGAGRVRLVRHLLTESILLALFGGIAGVVLGMAASQTVGSVPLHTFAPITFDFSFDWRVFTFALAVALLTGIFVGVAPALRASRGDVNQALHDGGRTSTPGRQRVRTALVAMQVAGSLMLLVVAGLFVRSLEHVEHSNLGFNPEGVLNVSFDPHEAGYNKAQTRDLFRNLLQQARHLPGVQSASLATCVPMGYNNLGATLKIKGYEPGRNEGEPFAEYNAVTGGYFETMRIQLLRGREFRGSDIETSPRVAIINQAMADRFWRGQDPIGRQFTRDDDPTHPMEIVGLARNLHPNSYEAAAPVPSFYVPLAQSDERFATLQARTNGDPASLAPELTGLIHSLEPVMPVFDVQTMTSALETLNGFLIFQLAAGLAVCLGLLGLVLAVVGVYGVISYAASRRTHEIGIRMAVGAQAVDVLKMIFSQGLAIVLIGMVLGLVAAIGMARIVRDFLVGVGAVDPLTYSAATFVLAGVALLACYIPARRAMRVDPMVALRHE
ncbi:MAG TPA: ABC transporter permease [Candidatus Acidoferrum sp.]|nr:ABC transporter permease [Candidatus Acidoferrum sp.]